MEGPGSMTPKSRRFKPGDILLVDFYREKHIQVIESLSKYRYHTKVYSKNLKFETDDWSFDMLHRYSTLIKDNLDEIKAEIL